MGKKRKRDMELAAVLRPMGGAPLRPGGEVLVESLPLSRNFGLSPGKAQSLELTGSWTQVPGQTRTAPNTALPLQARKEGTVSLLPMT